MNYTLRCLRCALSLPQEIPEVGEVSQLSRSIFLRKLSSLCVLASLFFSLLALANSLLILILRGNEFKKHQTYTYVLHWAFRYLARDSDQRHWWSGYVRNTFRLPEHVVKTWHGQPSATVIESLPAHNAARGTPHDRSPLQQHQETMRPALQHMLQAS